MALSEVYTKKDEPVKEALRQGEIDYADVTRWFFPDEFLSFILKFELLERMERSYPTPRKKHEIPIWFLMSAQILLRFYQSRHYEPLYYFLNSGSVLTRVGFNLSESKLGFNQKNRYPRTRAIHSDTVRKFFKDTHPEEIRHWYSSDIQKWFSERKAFDPNGIFLLDQTHLVVPDNGNYEGATWMPVDENGQKYKRYNELTNEQKQAIRHHRCYALTILLNVNEDGDHYHVAAYEIGPGNEDELSQAERLLKRFVKSHPDKIELLIMDRGYISKDFLAKLQKQYRIGFLLPLRKNMSDYKDALSLSQQKQKNEWTCTEEKKDKNGELQKKTMTTHIPQMNLWSDQFDLSVYPSQSTQWNEKKKDYEQYEWVLASNTELTPQRATQLYRLRTQIEERNRQLKEGWQIHTFPSPARGLIESHVCFTLLTYSLLQLYLRRKDLKEQTKQFIHTLQQEEEEDQRGIIIYAEGHYTVMGVPEYTEILLEMDKNARTKIRQMKKNQQGGMMRTE